MRKPKIEDLVHLIMVVFALASIGNIGEYLNANGHNWLTANGIALALGGVLVALSIMLSRTDYDREWSTFLWMFIATLAVALLSGTVQMWAYEEHTTPWRAFLQGYSFPIVGECLLAVASSMYSAAERRRRVRDAASHTQIRVAEAMAEALSHVDVSKAKDYVERGVNRIVRAQIDHVVREMLPVLNTEQDTEQVAPVQIEQKTPVNTCVERPDSDEKAGALDDLNAKRQDEAVQRRDRIVQIIVQRGDMPVTQLASELDVARGTIYNDLRELEAIGRIHRNGNGIEVLE